MPYDDINYFSYVFTGPSKTLRDLSDEELHKALIEGGEFLCEKECYFLAKMWAVSIAEEIKWRSLCT